MKDRQRSVHQAGFDRVIDASMGEKKAQNRKDDRERKKESKKVKHTRLRKMATISLDKDVRLHIETCMKK